MPALASSRCQALSKASLEKAIERNVGQAAHCAANPAYVDTLRAGADLPANVNFSASTKTDRDLLVRQMADHVALIENDEEVLKEACCDLLAVETLVLWRTEAPRDGRATAPSMEEICDLFVIGLRASRFLMIDGFARQYAGHVAAGSDPSGLQATFARLTARHNIVVDCLLGRFSRECARIKQRGAIGADAHQQQEAHFRHDVEVVIRRSTDRLLRPIEKIGMFHLDDERWSREREECETAVFGGRKPNRDRCIAAVDQRMAQIPF